MARISSEKAVEAVGNRFDLVLIAAARARELARGHKPKVDTKGNKNLVVAIREVELGQVGRDYLKKIR